MLKKIFTTCCLLALSCAVFALDASISYATFKSPTQNYIEIYMHLSGQSVTFVPVDSTLQKAELEVVILFKQGEEIVKYDKFLMSSPLAEQPLDFVDLKRYALENGDYLVDISVKDVHQEENAKSYKTEVTVDFVNDEVQQSDLQLLAAIDKAVNPNHPFVKLGYQLEPMPYHFYDKNATHLLFYSEVYNTDAAIGEDFLVSYSINELVNDESKMIKIGHKREKAKAIVPLVVQMEIGDVPSGNYELVVEVRNRLNELLSQESVFFQRSNPFLNAERIELAEVPLENEFVQRLTAEELEYSLRALTPKVSQADMDHLNAILAKDNLDAQRLFLFSYWTQQDPNQPIIAYESYMQVVKAVNNEFKSGFRHGFETDRGFYYLKYGQPDDITRVIDDPSAPPYEIWSYNDFPYTQQTNVRFVFYNPSLAGGDFVLLHSNARGELNNPQWQVELYRRNAPDQIQGSDYINATEMQDNWGRRAGRNFIDY